MSRVTRQRDSHHEGAQDLAKRDQVPIGRCCEQDYHYLSQNETHQSFSEEQHTRTPC
jgi:hypothetical protein